MRILVTGGLGYIGSHTCLKLKEAGFPVHIIDNLSNSKLSVLDRIKKLSDNNIGFDEIDLRDIKSLYKVFRSVQPILVIHFAGLKAVAESLDHPLKYYENNVVSSLNLLKVMNEVNCNKLVFSSSATVYGCPMYLPYDEKHPTVPVNPYGRTKLYSENMFADWAECLGSRSVISLRYFNPVGAHSSGIIGEDPNGIPNNLMPIIAKAASMEKLDFQIFGNDYPTRDGTPERDYIHVEDLAEAHLHAVKKTEEFNGMRVVNIGSGKGTTVLELLNAFKNVLKKDIKFTIGNRREGDLPSYWADITLAKKFLSWEPKRGVNEICDDVWRWQVKKNQHNFIKGPT